MRIFDPVKKHKKWLLTSGLRPLENPLRRVVRLCGDEGDYALMMSARRQAIKGRRRLDVNRDSLRLCQLHEIGKLPVGSQQKQPLKWTCPCAQCFAYGMQSVNQFRLTIASTGWFRLAYPR